MRIAIVGLGRIGSFHARTLVDLAIVDDVVAFDLDTGRLTCISRSLGLEPLGDFEDLLTCEPDGVVICTPTDTHASLICRAAAAGIPVFTEKPVSISAIQTRAVLRQVQPSGVPVQVGFQRRFDSEFLRARAAVQAGRLGWLHTVRANTFDPYPPPAEYVPSSGGLFRDCNVHDVDALRWVTGEEVVSVYAVGANRGANFFIDAGDVDSGSALLTLSDGTHAQIAASRYNGGNYDVRMELLGSSAQFEMSRGSSSSADFVTRFASAYREEIRSFIGVVRGEHPPTVNIEDALAAAWICEACELSRAQGGPVALVDVIGERAAIPAS